VGGESLGEFGRIAQLAGGDLREDEPVVPFAAGLLQRLKLFAEVTGSHGRLRRGFGEITGQLRTLANLVQLRDRAGDRCGRGGRLEVPVSGEDQLDQLRLAERYRFRRRQCGQQLPKG
jgi:hypothetical protein